MTRSNGETKQYEAPGGKAAGGGASGGETAGDKAPGGGASGGKTAGDDAVDIAVVPDATEVDVDADAASDGLSSITLSKAALSWLGVFVKDYRQPEAGFPNRYWLEYGYDLDAMNAETWIEMIHPDDRAGTLAFVQEVLDDPRHTGSHRYRVRDVYGEWHWILSKGTVETAVEDGTPLRFIGVDHDITEIQRLEEELREARRFAEEQAYEAETLRAAGAVITGSLNRDDAVAQVTTHLREIVGVERVFIFERDGRRLRSIDGSRFEIFEAGERDVDDLDEDEPGSAAVRELFSTGHTSADPHDGDRSFLESDFGTSAVVDVLRRRAPDIVRDPERSSSLWLLIPLVSRNRVLGVVAAVRRTGREYEGRQIRFAMALCDYMALALVNAQLYEEMQHLATTDQLSSLLTRRAFFERAEAAYAESPEAVTHTVMILDIDFFKQINDDFGHLVGDEAIRDVADVLRSHVRQGDLVGRYGGEEFAAFLPDTDSEAGRSVAERICEIVRSRRFESINRPVTVSIGLASVRREAGAMSFSEVLNSADGALYTAKRNGRDQVCVAP